MTPTTRGVMTTRGFFGRSRDAGRDRLPPGQYLERSFPVLSYEATPAIDRADWRFTIDAVDGSASWTWDEMLALPQSTLTVDIHCVTKWTKLDTTWQGVTVDDFLAAAGLELTQPYVLATCYTGYTTNLPSADVRDGQAIVAHTFDGEPLDPVHGGPARLLVPHLYFWKSAKWIRGLRAMEEDTPGFWEGYGYHMRGDPWREQRYAGD
jgi:DMSO/TMAO reductase YedYZ molybdopterin-dependent catalytic subunit